MNHRTYSSIEIATRHQLHAEISGHGDHVEQWVTDGHKAVIGHHGQEKNVQHCRECEKINLRDAAFIDYSFILGLDVPQHLWDGGGGETDVSKGQVGEEEVHGDVEVGV